MYTSIVESLITYVAETWAMAKKNIDDGWDGLPKT